MTDIPGSTVPARRRPRCRLCLSLPSSLRQCRCYRGHQAGISTSMALGINAMMPSATMSVTHGPGNHSHDPHRQHDRNDIAGAAGRQLIDHPLQLFTGRPSDQQRRFDTLDAGYFGWSATRHDPARRDATCDHQPGSDRDGGADAKYVGLRRERDDVSDDTRHDGPGQCHGCCRNAGRIVSVATRLLRGQFLFAGQAAAPNSKTLFNGAWDRQGLNSPMSDPGKMSDPGETHGVCRSLT